MRQGSLWMRLFPALWMRWAICIIVAAALIIGLIAFVDHNNNNSEAQGNKTALVQENQEDAIVVGADQAPHSVALTGGQSVHAGFVAAVRTDIRHRLKAGSIQGKVQKVGCHRSGARSGRIAYHCVAQVQNVKYPFVGVYTPTNKRVTICKRDPPPLRSENIPVSRRCRL
jgi:hypothetical protein